MCKRNSGLPNRPGPSLLAEGNLELEDDVEIEEGDKMGGQTEESWSMSGDHLFIDIMKNFV